MQVELSDRQATVLRSVLDEAIAEMASEIADTDNPRFRDGLEQRRGVLREVQEMLDPSYGSVDRPEGGNR